MNPEEVSRERYIQKLDMFRDQMGLAKVITGVRRCGKSTLLRQYRDHITSSGVPEEHIIYATMESDEFSHIKERDDLYSLIVSKGKTERIYVFLDEVQRVKDWELAIVSALVDTNADIYVTGSNAYMLSSDLITFLAGRYIEIHMLPFSFKEFMCAKGYGPENKSAALREYLFVGSIPVAVRQKDLESSNIVLKGIYSEIVLKDIMGRDNVRQGSLLERVSRYVLANTGNIISPGSLAKAIGHKNSSIIEAYLEFLHKAFIVYRVERYDIRRKQSLSSQSKYYCVDVGMRNALLGRSAADVGRLLETTVYLELIRRGYSVTVGSYNDLKIDFTASKGDEVKHIQVTAYMSEDVLLREVRALDMIGDHNEKMIISIDSWPGSINGIRTAEAAEWLFDDGM